MSITLRSLTVLSLAIAPSTANAALRPEEVAILAMENSAESRQVAQHYAEARNIPASHICYLEGRPETTLDRRAWEFAVRPAIRRWIATEGLETQIKCFVTVWDVPLRIGSLEEGSPQVAGRIAYLQGERQARLRRVEELIDQLDPPATAEEQAERFRWPPGVQVEIIRPKLASAMDAARDRAARVNDRKQRQEIEAALANAVATAGGLAAVAEALSRQQGNDAAQNQAASLELVRGRLAGLREGQGALEQLPESVERDQQILALVERMGGLAGSMQWIDAQLELLEDNETAASFDSELALLYWPDYPLTRWQPNMLHHRFDGSYERWLRTTLMVSRLEAPTLELTLGLIDTAVEVESRGLRGTVYLDAKSNARGRTNAKRGSYAEYDRSLAELADVLKSHTDLDVEFDTDQEVFQPGDCPDAALYCGWYSLRKYVDAFEWRSGAVGYHIASAEATTLRDAQSTVWCKRMLEEGVCATLGPTFEPYLAAFPKPEEFFVLLASGRYTLAECYYRCQPFNSWAMVLVGDPLYNPFKTRPQFDVSDLPESLQRLLGENLEP